jgi:hypothetical protein
MKVGVGVEGPSDRKFWDKVLHKHFRNVTFDIRNMKDRQKLIRETPRLLQFFRDAHYDAGIILVDRNDSLCVTEVISEFEEQIRSEARKQVQVRYLHICVAIRELEAWFLADAEAVNAVLPNVNCKPSNETGSLNAERILRDLWKKQYPNTAFNKIDFAGKIAPKFKPEEARAHSRSFEYFWARISRKCQHK